MERLGDLKKGCGKNTSDSYKSCKKILTLFNCFHCWDCARNYFCTIEIVWKKVQLHKGIPTNLSNMLQILKNKYEIQRKVCIIAASCTVYNWHLVEKTFSFTPLTSCQRTKLLSCPVWESNLRPWQWTSFVNRHGWDGLPDHTILSPTAFLKFSSQGSCLSLIPSEGESVICFALESNPDLRTKLYLPTVALANTLH